MKFRLSIYFGILSATVVLAVGCSRDQEAAPVNGQGQSLPDRTIWNGTIEVMEAGRLQSLVQAGRIETYDRTRTTLMDSGVVVDFFNSAGQHTSQLTSRAARIEEGRDLFLAEGDVVVTSDSGATLYTERLYWDRQRQRIRSDTLVTMTTDFDSLRGFDFESNEDLTSWTLQRPTGTTFRRVTRR